MPKVRGRGPNGPVLKGRWATGDIEANVEVGITGLDAVDELRREPTHRGVESALARVKQDLLDDLRAYGLVDSVGKERIFPTLPTAAPRTVRGPDLSRRACPAP